MLNTKAQNQIAKIGAVMMLGIALPGAMFTGFDNSVAEYNINAPVEEPHESPIETPSEDREETTVESVRETITRIFGEDSEKAFKLLECENGSLDPLAVNDNTTWGGIGRDRGIFQINDVYHPYVTDECAFNVECNTKYAYRMFVNDNYQFIRWTCGRDNE